MQKGLILILIATLLLTPIFGCKTSNQGSWIGAGVGAAAGGLLGGIIGHQSGNKWKGALIGGAIGGLAGYIAGTELGAGSDESAKSSPEYDQAEAYFDQANQTSDPNQAIALYERSIQADAQHPEPYNNMGLRYLQLGNRPMARNSFQRALDVAPYFEPARQNLTRMDSGQI